MFTTMSYKHLNLFDFRMYKHMESKVVSSIVCGIWDILLVQVSELFHCGHYIIKSWNTDLVLLLLLIYFNLLQFEWKMLSERHFTANCAK